MAKTWLCLKGKCIHAEQRTTEHIIPSSYLYGKTQKRYELVMWCHKYIMQILTPKYRCKHYTTRRLIEWLEEEANSK